MWTAGLSILGAVLSLSAVGAQAQGGVVCDTRQPRDTVSQSGTDFAKNLKDTISKSVGDLCIGGFKNEDKDGFVTYQSGSTVFAITRADDNAEPSEGCTTNFNDIVDQCIANGNVWGGSVVTGGLMYEIYNNDIMSNGSKSALTERDVEDEEGDIVSLEARKAKKTKAKKTKTKAKKTKTKAKKTKPKPKKTKTKPKKTKSKPKTKKPTKTTKGASKATKTPKATPSAASCELKPKSGKKSGKISARFAALWSRTETCDQGIPTVKEIKAHLKIAANQCVFYSGQGGYSAKAQQWANKKNKADGTRYRILSALWADQDWRDPYVKTTANAKIFNSRASEAMARTCSGVAYVLLPTDTKGTQWKSGTVWDEDEWPNMSSAVTKVIRVNPENDDEETIKG